MFNYEGLSPGVRERIEGLADQNGWTLDIAVNELLIEAIAMGGLTFALRPKVELTAINGPPKGVGQISDTNPPN